MDAKTKIKECDLFPELVKTSETCDISVENALLLNSTNLREFHFHLTQSSMSFETGSGI